MTAQRMTSIAVIVISLLSHLAGPRAAGEDEKEFFAARRQVLMKKIPGGLAILQGAVETRAYARFRQDNNFYYLTGVETPGAFLLLDAARNRSTLFLPPRDHHHEVWEGERLSAGPEARAATGIEEVLEVAVLEVEWGKLKGSEQEFYTPLSPEETAGTSRDRAADYAAEREKSPWDGRVSREKAFVNNLRRTLGGSANIKDLSPVLDAMRRVKDTQEIDRLRESAKIGAAALKEAIRAAKPGRYEYQLAAAAELIFRWRGALGPAYFSIVASGPNSCIIHYNADTRRMESGDLVVMDSGPDYRYYASDITRTFPVSGRFSDEQALIYQVVLEAQEAGLKRVRPGASFATIADAVKEVLARRGYAKYLPHGVSHYVGMSTHDVGGAAPFEPGAVLTVEPGVYLPEKNLGIRIEDTVLVTKEGCEVLSRDVPKEIRAIERLMTAKKMSLP